MYYYIAAILAVALWILLRQKKLANRAAISVLLPYLFLVGAATFITRRENNDTHIILKPFWTIQAIITGGQQKAWLMKEVCLNVLMLMPVGALLPLIFENRKLQTILLTGIVISLIIEISQLLTNTGFFEIDDIIFNTIGVLLGYGSFCIVKRMIYLENNDG